MLNFPKKYQLYLKDKGFLISAIVGVLLLLAGITVTFFAIIYATERASAPVTDIILSNIPTIDVDGIFIFGPIIFWIIIAAYLFFVEPRKIPFTLKSLGLFMIIRSFFLILTHIGPFPNQIHTDISGIIGVFTSGSDLFFSSHTGMPFLIALIFWRDVPVRRFSIIASCLFGLIVLLGHYHYSIDVFAAFFITYAIFHICERLFKKDRESPIKEING